MLPSPDVSFAKVDFWFGGLEYTWKIIRILYQAEQNKLQVAIHFARGQPLSSSSFFSFCKKVMGAHYSQARLPRPLCASSFSKWRASRESLPHMKESYLNYSDSHCSSLIFSKIFAKFWLRREWLWASEPHKLKQNGILLQAYST